MTFTETVIAVAVGVVAGIVAWRLLRAVGELLGVLIALLIGLMVELWDWMRWGPERRRAAKARMADAEAKVQRAREAKPKPHECGKLCEGTCPEWWKR